jgi:hypothetical protein
MATKLIELEDGTLVEVEVPEDQAQQISSRFADRVSTTFDKIQPILVKTCRPIAAAWKEINQEMQIEQAEIEIGFSFEGEGNIYVTKAKAGSNLKVKLVLKPKVD